MKTEASSANVGEIKENRCQPVVRFHILRGDRRCKVTNLTAQIKNIIQKILQNSVFRKRN